MWREPARRALGTASAATSFSTCQTPKPSWGMERPSWKVRVGELVMVLLRIGAGPRPAAAAMRRSEEHTSELQSRGHLVCRLLLVKKMRCSTEVAMINTSHNYDI